eukprot:GHUV01034720.1.p1 GENE.GHUV01034720.1~~GHUV01034720.1.p1  ORF type:complete len:101 (-),score=20.37 GHUV01034720.1:9-311(-)
MRYEISWPGGLLSARDQPVLIGDMILWSVACADSSRLTYGWTLLHCEVQAFQTLSWGLPAAVGWQRVVAACMAHVSSAAVHSHSKGSCDGDEFLRCSASL